MRKKLNQILNIIMASSAGVFIGSVLFRYWHYQKYPDLYTVASAPWYTGILINGLFLLAVLTLCMIVKAALIKETGLKEKTALILGIIFLFLTFTGGGYVLINHGQVNAGYAVVPGIWAMICFGYYRARRQHLL